MYILCKQSFNNKLHKIKRECLFVAELVARPDRIAIEPTTGNIYFTAVSDFSFGLNDSMIGVFDGNRTSAIVVWEGQQPRDIALDSAMG